MSGSTLVPSLGARQRSKTSCRTNGHVHNITGKGDMQPRSQASEPFRQRHCVLAVRATCATNSTLQRICSGKTPLCICSEKFVESVSKKSLDPASRKSLHPASRVLVLHPASRVLHPSWRGYDFCYKRRDIREARLLQLSVIRQSRLASESTEEREAGLQQANLVQQRK